jgi:glucosyl-dolichyl phosphate glucuronosyltransferase
VRLDVIIPTYNRHEMLARTFRSILRADVPSGLDVTITTVDNNSTDATRQTVEEYAPQFSGRLRYIVERQRGRSHALNAGIRNSDADLIGMIDDDEEIDAQWFACIFSSFADPTLDFIGGPCLPCWGAEPPPWLPPDYPGVIGWVNAGDRIQPYDESYPGILMGGNAILRRSVLQTVGPYPTALGRTDKHLLTGEDEQMYRWLRASGARGLYMPSLVIYHYVPPARLTKRYYRQWCFWRGVSLSVLEKDEPSNVAHLLGVPRWLFGRAVRGMMTAARQRLLRRWDPSVGFSAELTVCDLAGFLYGRHVYQRRAR